MVSFHPILKKSYYILAGIGGIWVLFLVCLMNPWFQRHVLYSHQINPGFWGHVDEPEAFGFAKGQVTPFHLNTSDGETLYCWHILPVDVYLENEVEIVQKASEDVVEDLKTTVGYKLLMSDAESRVVVNFHGNAGHLASSHRPSTYRSITSIPSTHLLTCSYRGFGTSTLHNTPHIPTEPGLITDGISILHHLLTTLAHPASRTILLSQSLGTAIASASALYFTNPSTTLLPTNLTLPPATQTPVSFASIILVSPFPSLTTLLKSYRIRGVIPILSPLASYPKISNFLLERIVDSWDTLPRLRALLAAAKSHKLPVRIHILHARNDMDVSFKVGEAVYAGLEEVLRGEQGVVSVHERRSVNMGIGNRGFGKEVTRGAFAYRKVEVKGGFGVLGGTGGERVVECEVLRFGGHEEGVGWVGVQLAVRRVINGGVGGRRPGLDVE